MDPLQLILSTGAAGALFYIVKLLVDGKLHTNSEVDGLKADKADLLKINAAQADALRQSNEQQLEILQILRGPSRSYPGDRRSE